MIDEVYQVGPYLPPSEILTKFEVVDFDDHVEIFAQMYGQDKWIKASWHTRVPRILPGATVALTLN